MADPSKSGSNRWLRLFSILVPGDIRHQFVGDLIAEREEMRDQNEQPALIFFMSLKEILSGIAQHMPLRPAPTGSIAQPPLADRAALFGWIAWRISGPALLCGYLFGSGAVFWTGVAMLVLAFASVLAVAMAGREPMTAPQTRLVNGVLVGTFTALILILVFSLLAFALLALATVFSSGLIASVAMSALAFVATAVACGISGSGWVPEEWYPKRLVEV
jgi:hypothetical protein